MLKEYDPLKEIEQLLDKDNVSEVSKASILMNFKRLRDRVSEVEERLYWLEGAIDESDNEDVYVSYQKHFSLNHWSGDPD